MFRSVIESPQWNNSTPEMFNGVNQKYDDTYGCGSLTATLRALLFNKEIKVNGEKFDWFHKQRRLDKGDECYDITRCTPFPIREAQNKIFFLEVYCGNVDEAFKTISDELVGYLKEHFYVDFHEVEKVKTFYKKTMNVLCFINPEKKVSLVIYEKRGVDCHHYMQIGIPTYLPWFFCLRDEQGNPITNEDGSTKLNLSAEESELLKTLRERDSAPYLSALEKIAEVYNLEEARLEKALGDFEKQWAYAHLDETKRNIEELIRRIKESEIAISGYLTQKREKEMMLSGLNKKIEDTESHTLEYFKTNKALKLVRAESGDIVFDSIGFVENYDEEIAEEFVDNTRSVLYSNSNLDLSDTEKLFRALFVDSTVKLKTIAQYSIDINRNRVEGHSDPSYTPGLVHSYFPNPHIHYYSCLGDYSRMMCEALEKEDIITCLELCQMSTRSLNFADETVMEKFVSRITSNKRDKIYQLPDGSSANLTEVLKYVSEDVQKESEEEKGE